MCTRSEGKWRTAGDYAIRSMAQTRAVSKALRLPLGFIMQLAGYSATPAEEIAADEQPEPGERTGREASRSAAATTPAPAQYRRAELAQVMADRHLDNDAVIRYADAIGIPRTERPMSNESMDRLIAAIIRDSARGEQPGLLDEVLAATGGTLIDSDASPASEPEAGVLAPAPAAPPKPGTKAYRDLPDGEARAAAKAYWVEQEAAA
jgi:hypothetical protein